MKSRMSRKEHDWTVAASVNSAEIRSASEKLEGRLQWLESPLCVAYERWAGHHGCGIIGGRWGWGSLPGG